MGEEMTKTEFFQSLPGTNRQWIVLPSGEIRARRLRRGGMRDSPLSAVARLHAKVRCRADDVLAPARALKLHPELAQSIDWAVNYRLRELTSHAARSCRKELFKILSLPQDKL